MEHLIIDIGPGMQQVTLLKKENNLDQLDNLSELPEQPAVYAICGRVNNKPANARMVGTAANLREAVLMHFSDGETNECLRQFMQSIKIKELVYELLPGASSEQLAQKKTEWSAQFKPACNETLNKVY